MQIKITAIYYFWHLIDPFFPPDLDMVLRTEWFSPDVLLNSISIEASVSRFAVLINSDRCFCLPRDLWSPPSPNVIADTMVDFP